MANSRTKGQQGEHLARAVMESITGEKWRRSVQYNGAGAVGDIIPVDPESDWTLAHVEVKNVAGMELGNHLWRSALAQAERDRPAGSFTVLLWRVTPRLWAVATWDSQLGAWTTYTADEAAPALRRKLEWAKAERDGRAA